MSRWLMAALFGQRSVRDNPPARMTFTKVQSGQCPTAVALGWEEERRNPYWSCDQTGDLYEKTEDGSFKKIKLIPLTEFLESKGVAP